MENNVITEFDGKRVRSIEALIDLLQYYEPGEEIEVTLQVMDGDGYKEKTVTVTLGEDDSKDDEKSDDNGDGSGEQSILEDWQNGEKIIQDTKSSLECGNNLFSLINIVTIEN